MQEDCYAPYVGRWSYRFVSQGVSVGAKEGCLRAKEGPGHPTSCCRGLLLQLTLQTGDLGQQEREREGDRGRWGGGGKEGRKKLTPLKLVDGLTDLFSV